MTRFISLGYSIGRFLETIGFSESRAVRVDYKIGCFTHWLYRHPLTMLIITMPKEGMDGKWHQCRASFDDVKFVKSTGIWRKTLYFQCNAKVHNE